MLEDPGTLEAWMEAEIRAFFSNRIRNAGPLHRARATPSAESIQVKGGQVRRDAESNTCIFIVHILHSFLSHVIP